MIMCKINNIYNGSSIGGCILNILDPLVNMNSENGFIIPHNYRQISEINNFSMRSYPNLCVVLHQVQYKWYSWDNIK